MDPVTHSLAGAALARAGLHRLTPLATTTLVLSANAPDIDVLAYARGSYAMLALRRGVSHGPLGWIVLPLLVTAIVLAYDRWRRRRREPDAEPAGAGPVLALALIGTLTHAPLDWLNTWGVRILAPFVDRWFYGDALFIIDPWVWLALGTVVVPLTRTRRGWIGWFLLALGTLMLMMTTPDVPRAAGMVFLLLSALLALGVVLGRRRGVVPGEAWARGAMAAVLVYISAMIGADQLGRAHTLRAAQARGLEVQQLMVAPAPANPFGASIVVQTADAYQLGELSWLRRERLRWTNVIPFGPRDNTVLATLQLPEVRDFLRWSRFPYVQLNASEPGRVVRWSDARYPSSRGGGMNGVDVQIDLTSQSPARPR